jgi:glutamine synthetase
VFFFFWRSLRIECRIPGADVNPYLAFAASLASGLDGIKNKIEPPAYFEGNVYEAQTLPQVCLFFVFPVVDCLLIHLFF